MVTPILADVGEVHKTLALIAQRHFQECQLEEVSTLASFVFAVQAKGEWQIGQPFSRTCLQAGQTLAVHIMDGDMLLSCIAAVCVLCGTGGFVACSAIY